MRNVYVDTYGPLLSSIRCSCLNISGELPASSHFAGRSEAPTPTIGVASMRTASLSGLLSQMIRILHLAAGYRWCSHFRKMNHRQTKDRRALQGVAIHRLKAVVRRSVTAKAQATSRRFGSGKHGCSTEYLVARWPIDSFHANWGLFLVCFIYLHLPNRSTAYYHPTIYQFYAVNSRSAARSTLLLANRKASRTAFSSKPMSINCSTAAASGSTGRCCASAT